MRQYFTAVDASIGNGDVYGQLTCVLAGAGALADANSSVANCLYLKATNTTDGVYMVSATLSKAKRVIRVKMGACASGKVAKPAAICREANTTQIVRHHWSSSNALRMLHSNAAGTNYYWDYVNKEWTTSVKELTCSDIEGCIFEIERTYTGYILRQYDANGALIGETDEVAFADLYYGAESHRFGCGDFSTVDNTMECSWEWVDLDCLNLVAALKSKTRHHYKKIYIKRRESSGDYEADWYDITDEVKDIGDIENGLDDIKFNTFSPGSVDITFDNAGGKFNDEKYPSSIFSEFLTPYKTKVKIEYALGADDSLASLSPEAKDFFHGILIDDPDISPDEATCTFNALSYVLEEQSAEDLSLLATDTASDIIGKIRDLEVDSVRVFDKYIDTWNIEATTAVYTDITAANALKGMSCWDVIVKLAEAENMCAYMGKDGSFNFCSKSLGAWALPDNLYLFYKFNGNLNDDSSQGNDGEKVDSLWWDWFEYVAGKAESGMECGSAYRSTGYAKWSYVRTTSHCKFMQNGDAGKWEITLWYRLDEFWNSTGDECDIIRRASDVHAALGTKGDFRLYLDKNGTLFDLKFSYYDTSQHNYTLSGSTSERITEGAKYGQINIGYDGTNLYARLNNAEIYSSATSLDCDDSSNTHKIYLNAMLQPSYESGIGFNNGNVGQMDILMILADNLSAAERSGLYNYGVGSEQGIFSADTSNPAYEFYGNIFNDVFGTNIIEIVEYSNGWGDVYNFIQCEYGDGTYQTAKETWTPGDGGSTDKYGQRKYSFTNWWMNSSEASAAVLNIFNQNYAPRKRLIIKTPIIPGIDLMNIVYVNTGTFMGITANFFGVITNISTNLVDFTAEYSIKELV